MGLSPKLQLKFLLVSPAMGVNPALYYAGRLDEARMESLKLREMDQNCPRANYELGLVLEEERNLRLSELGKSLGLH